MTSTIVPKKLLSLRKKLLGEQELLKNIANSSTSRVRHLLNASNSKQLHLLVKIIHHIVSGDIKLKTSDFALVTKAKKLSFLTREFEREKDLAILLKKDRGDILSVLYKIQSVIPILLRPIVTK